MSRVISPERSSKRPDPFRDPLHQPLELFYEETTFGVDVGLHVPLGRNDWILFLGAAHHEARVGGGNVPIDVDPSTLRVGAGACKPGDNAQRCGPSQAPPDCNPARGEYNRAKRRAWGLKGRRS